MTDEELMRSAGLFKHDHQTGKDGYSLAAVLLLGKDDVIQSVLSHHKTDAILRVENTDRYDDRDDIRTNLIESYDCLMAFIRKHLPDKFYQEGEQRISLRDRIFREVVGNMLIHREYANAFPAKLIIDKERVFAKFFKEIGRVDELGSGVRNTFKYCSIYTPGTKPEFIEDDVFKTIIPLKAQDIKTIVHESKWEEVRRKVGEKLTDNQFKILVAMYDNPYISGREIAVIINISERKTETNIAKLKRMDLITRIGPAKGGYWKINI